MSGKTRVKTHYLRGRDAGHFGRWLGGRSDVIYPIMSNEQRRKQPKGALLPSGERFWLQRGSQK